RASRQTPTRAFARPSMKRWAGRVWLMSLTPLPQPRRPRPPARPWRRDQRPAVICRHRPCRFLLLRPRRRPPPPRPGPPPAARAPAASPADGRPEPATAAPGHPALEHFAIIRSDGRLACRIPEATGEPPVATIQCKTL